MPVAPAAPVAPLPGLAPPEVPPALPLAAPLDGAPPELALPPAEPDGEAAVVVVALVEVVGVVAGLVAADPPGTVRPAGGVVVADVVPPPPQPARAPVNSRQAPIIVRWRQRDRTSRALLSGPADPSAGRSGNSR